MKRRILLAVGVVGLMLIIAFAFASERGWLLPAYNNDIDGFMMSRMKNMEVPGLTAGIVMPGGKIWEGYYGTYDGDHPVSEDTLFMIASVSKTVVATAIMQLWEQGYFNLDDDVNDYLDFEVVNPNFPDTKITFQHLMTHRSSIHDRYPFLGEMYTTSSGGGDSPWELGDFLQAYLVPEGQFFTNENYLQNAPGKHHEYSNYGVALLAYLVEVFSQEKFATYCANHIFIPLGMEHSFFLLNDIPESENEIASLFQDGVALPHYNYPDYPTGSLRTTVRDMARFASYYLNPSPGDPSILQPETIALMFRETDKENQIGLIWWTEGEKSIGHDGWDDGAATNLTLYPDEGIGTILFVNGDPKNYDVVFPKIIERLRIEGQN